VDERDWLAQRFERSRPQLRAVAYRMLGSQAEADDAVQESWLRVSRADAAGVENLGGWLTTIVARVCLDMLRARRTRREEPLELQPAAPAGSGADPERELLLADSVGMAMLVVLEALTPAERVAFVLHDMFAVPFEDVAEIVGKSPAAARQLASRARRRVRGAETGADVDVDPVRQREIVGAFLAASRSGDFDALLALLDPEVELTADETGARMGAYTGLRGAQTVAAKLAGGARVLRPALLGGMPGLVWMLRGEPQVAFGFTVVNGLITRIDLIADPERLREMDVVPVRRPADSA
jgi:RNA polymerase sigma factor (sigma-70 family)